MAAKLKIFITSNGLSDFVVATTSKVKALQAWGVGQDLFKAGQAHETDDPALVEAATAQPGKVVQRPATTQDAIRALKPATVERRPSKPVARVEPTSAPAPKPANAEPPRPPPRPVEPQGPTPAQLRKVAEAEAKLAAAKAAHRETAEELGQGLAGLEADLDSLKDDLARLKKEQVALERKQARLKGEQEALETRAAQERKRFAAQEAILKARLEASKAALP